MVENLTKWYWWPHLLAITFLCLIGSIFTLMQEQIDSDIDAGYSLTKGRVVFFGKKSLNMTLSPSFEYHVDGIKYKSSFDIDILCMPISEADKNKTKALDFIVVYSKQNHSSSRLLINKSQLEKYGVEHDYGDADLFERVFFSCK